MPAETTVNTVDGAIQFETPDQVNTSQVNTSPHGVTFLEGGKGLPVLLLHAFPLSSAMWRSQIQVLASDFRVIAPDMRGFGGTPAFTGAPSVDQMADDAAGLLDDLKIRGPVTVGGLSMGGYVALAFARRHANRLRAVILADTRAEPDDAAARLNRDKLIEFASHNPSTAVVEQLLSKMVCAETLQKRPEVIDAVKYFASLQAPAGIINALKALRDRPDATPFLPSIAVATLVIVGREDALTPPAVAEKLKAAIPGARMIVLEKAGHLSNLEQPEAFNTAVRDFLAAL
ncbi:MAG TPA: alpha/beta fold hydrolase [Gemmataceae bacterium]|nr:alpha/beta fold hydrolase [Gemmataceae bacterium]